MLYDFDAIKATKGLPKRRQKTKNAENHKD